MPCCLEADGLVPKKRRYITFTCNLIIFFFFFFFFFFFTGNQGAVKGDGIVFAEIPWIASGGNISLFLSLYLGPIAKSREWEINS
jgi:hypothetical protein